ISIVRAPRSYKAVEFPATALTAVKLNHTCHRRKPGNRGSFRRDISGVASRVCVQARPATHPKCRSEDAVRSCAVEPPQRSRTNTLVYQEVVARRLVAVPVREGLGPSLVRWRAQWSGRKVAERTLQPA